jgi:hypothetical protein
VFRGALRTPGEESVSLSFSGEKHCFRRVYTGSGKKSKSLTFFALRPEALAAAEEDEASPKRIDRIKRAVERERSRLWDNQPRPRPAETQQGRDMQKQLGAAGVVVVRVVRLVATERLKSKESEAKSQIDAARNR